MPNALHPTLWVLISLFPFPTESFQALDLILTPPGQIPSPHLSFEEFRGLSGCCNGSVQCTAAWAIPEATVILSSPQNGSCFWVPVTWPEDKVLEVFPQLQKLLKAAKSFCKAIQTMLSQQNGLIYHMITLCNSRSGSDPGMWLQFMDACPEIFKRSMWWMMGVWGTGPRAAESLQGRMEERSREHCRVPMTGRKGKWLQGHCSHCNFEMVSDVVFTGCVCVSVLTSMVY